MPFRRVLVAALLLPLLLLPFAPPAGARAHPPAPFDPDLHRATLQANADRTATLEQVSRNPRRFRGLFAGFSGRIEAIAEEGGARRSATRLLVVNGPLAFTCRVPGGSDRFTRGAAVEAYGRLAGTATLFAVGRLPHMEAVRVLTQDDIARDDNTLRELAVMRAAREHGGPLESGRRLLAEGRPGDAYLAFELGHRTDRSVPDHVWRTELARALHALGRLQEARDHLEKAVADIRHGAAARLLLGRVLLDLGDPHGAARHLRRADGMTRTVESLRHLARAETLLGDAGSALRHYDLAVERAPGDADLRLARAEVAAKTGHLDTAVADLARFLAVNPDHVGATQLLAECERRRLVHRARERGELQSERIAVLEAANAVLGERFDPLRAEPIPDDLSDRLERAALAHPDRHRLANHLGLLALARNRPDEAVARFRRAVELAPLLPDLRWNLAHALLRANDLPGALEEFEAAWRLDPFMERARLRAQHVARALAFETAKGLRATGPERALFYRELGDRELARGDETEALFAWTEAARHDPLETRSLYKIGRLLHERGRATEATPRFREALRRGPGSPEGLRELVRLGYDAQEIKRLQGGRAR